MNVTHARALAHAAGWQVREHHNGGWGRPATRRCWKARPPGMPASAWPAKEHDTEEAALREVERRLAHAMGVSVRTLRRHLARLVEA